MDTLFERLSSGQIVAVISIVSGCVVGLAMIVAITKYQFQSLADDTTLKREKQQADLTLREKLVEKHGATGETVEQLLALGMSPREEEAGGDAELAKRFGMLTAPADEIEAALRRALAVDDARKRVIVEVMDNLFEHEAEHDAILAAVRPLCAAPAEDEEVEYEEPSPVVPVPRA